MNQTKNQPEKTNVMQVVILYRDVQNKFRLVYSPKYDKNEVRE